MGVDLAFGVPKKKKNQKQDHCGRGGILELVVRNVTLICKEFNVFH